MCEFEHCLWEKDIPAHLWEAMRRKAVELDLNRGGLWDARLGCINLWCSPDDKPSDWEGVEIKRYALNYPRAYVAGFYAEYMEEGKKAVRVHLVISPYEKMEYRAHRLDVYHYASNEDRAWCLEKFEELKGLVLREIKGKEGKKWVM